MQVTSLLPYPEDTPVPKISSNPILSPQRRPNKPGSICLMAFLSLSVLSSFKMETTNYFILDDVPLILRSSSQTNYLLWKSPPRLYPLLPPDVCMAFLQLHFIFFLCPHFIRGRSVVLPVVHSYMGLSPSLSRTITTDVVNRLDSVPIIAYWWT